MHGLADEVFAQHRPDYGEAVAAAGERGTPGTLEMQIHPATVIGHQFAEEQGPTVAEQRRVAPELVAGVRHRDGLCPMRR